MLLNPLTQLLPATVALTAAALYGAGAAALRGSRSPWPRLQTASFLAGVGVIAAGFVVPGLLGDSAHDPRLHMTVNLLMGMVGPLLVALSAPVTLAFRALRRPARRRLAALLGSRWSAPSATRSAL